MLDVSKPAKVAYSELDKRNTNKTSKTCPSISVSIIMPFDVYNAHDIQTRPHVLTLHKLRLVISAVHTYTTVSGT